MSDINCWIPLTTLGEPSRDLMLSWTPKVCHTFFFHRWSQMTERRHALLSSQKLLGLLQDLWLCGSA